VCVRVDDGWMDGRKGVSAFRQIDDWVGLCFPLPLTYLPACLPVARPQCF